MPHDTKCDLLAEIATVQVFIDRTLESGCTVAVAIEMAKTRLDSICHMHWDRMYFTDSGGVGLAANSKVQPAMSSRIGSAKPKLKRLAGTRR